MNRETLLIAYLSLSLLICQFLWLKAEKRASYLEGREAVFKEISDIDPEAHPYTDVKKKERR